MELLPWGVRSQNVFGYQFHPEKVKSLVKNYQVIHGIMMSKKFRLISSVLYREGSVVKSVNFDNFRSSVTYLQPCGFSVEDKLMS